jgi:hypothetical protein
MLYGLKVFLFVLIQSLMMARACQHVAHLINAFLMCTSLIYFIVLHFCARSQHSAKQYFTLTIVLCWGLTSADWVYGAVPSQEAYCFSASQIPCIVWNMKVNYHTQKSLPLVSLLSHLAHALQFIPLRHNFNIILPYMPRSLFQGSQPKACIMSLVHHLSHIPYRA